MVKKTISKKVSTVKITEPKNFLSPYAFGHSLGLVSAILMLILAVMAWFSDYNGYLITEILPVSFSFTNWTLIIGLLELYVLGYIAGWVFAGLYNKTAK